MGPKLSIYEIDPEHASKLSILFPCRSALLGHNLNSFKLKFSLTTRNIDWDPAFKNSKVNEPLCSITNSQAFVIWAAFNIKISYAKKEHPICQSSFLRWRDKSCQSPQQGSVQIKLTWEMADGGYSLLWIRERRNSAMASAHYVNILITGLLTVLDTMLKSLDVIPSQMRILL